MARKVIHVTPHSEGQWAVKTLGSRKALGVFESKPAAVSGAKAMVRGVASGQVIIHKQDGRIQAEYTYGGAAATGRRPK